MANDNPITESSKFDTKAFKYAISMVESAGGKYLYNNTSSAAGLYHFIYNNIKNNSQMKGMTKLEFIKDKAMQEQVMDWALEGKLEGYPNYITKAKEYQKAYAPDLSVEETAAMIHFLGAGGARKALKGSYNIPGKNATKDQYLNRFRKHYTPSMTQDVKDMKPKAIVKPANTQAIDNTAVQMPQVQMPQQEVQMPQVETQQVQTPQQDNFIKTEYDGNDAIGWLQNQKAFGGEAPSSGSEKLIEFANGGTHESNPHGGVPIGHDDRGVLNTVEQDETMHKLNGKDYIFSARLGLNTNKQ